MSEALARRSAEDELLQLLDQDEAAGQPATDEHREWARQALGRQRRHTVITSDPRDLHRIGPELQLLDPITGRA